ERGKEHIKLSTEYGGKSQLNLGHLVDGQRPHPDKRGEGFELRTDSWGVIRAGKGLFISADEQAKARGEVLSMTPAISLVKGAVNQVMEWGTVTKTHLNYSPDTESLKTYLQGVDQLKMAAMLLSAPEGIGVVSPQTVMLHSGQALYAQSAGDVHMASACRIGMNATQAISLLAQTEGMRLVSGKGPLTMESHGDELGLTALKDVTVKSTQGQVQIIAKNGLTLACGGAYIRLSPAGEVEIHGPGLLSLKGQHKMDAPAKQDFPLPDLPESVCKECLKKAQEMAQGFVLRK
ncbi:type VI secretion system Vgr family protein, partial [Photorhabdus heterorhabditis]|uniref:type VI secretion system Vgr family protein n=1 Tax=Photorhabdus heterorhabditis TaxID=880156 RepID=UPI001BD3ACDA